MKSNLLLTRLVLPLSAVTLISLGVHCLWAADGLFIYIATEMLGIVITVAYVDWVLKNQEKVRWKAASSKISKRLLILSNAAVSGLRTSLGFGLEFLDRSVLAQGDFKAANIEVMRVGTQVISPAVEARLKTLDQTGWEALTRHLAETWREIDRTISQFGGRLEPNMLEELLSLQEALQHSQIFARTFPDLAGVKNQDLPNAPNAVGLQAAGISETARDIRRVLSISEELSKICRTQVDA